MFDADPMDNLLLDAQDTTVVQQATAANDTFPAPYGDQQDEEALFAGLSGRPAKRAKVRAQGVRQVVRQPKMVGGGFLPGMGEDLDAMEVDGLGQWGRPRQWRRPAIFKTLKDIVNRPAPTPPAPAQAPVPWFKRNEAWQQMIARQQAERAAERAKALEARRGWREELQRKRQELNALRRQRPGGWWGGWWNQPATPAVTTTTSPPTTPATSTVTTPVIAQPAATETVVPVASAVDAVSAPVVPARTSIAPGSAPGSQFYGLDGLEGVVTARRARVPRPRRLAMGPGLRRLPMSRSASGGFLPGLGEECEECADGDDVSGLGAAPARLKPRVSRVQGSSRAPVRIPARRSAGGGFLPGMGDLGFAPTASPTVMLALGVVAAYFLLRK